MQREYKGVRYVAVEDVPVTNWMIQGTIYDSPEQAKYAAAKVFLNVTGVVVKQVKEGYTLFWWRFSRG